LPDEERRRSSTANEFVTLDEIDHHTAALKNVSFLLESARGAVCVSGSDAAFLEPSVLVDGHRLDLHGAKWTLAGHWVPEMTLERPEGTLRCQYLAPPARRGFAVRLQFTARAGAGVQLALEVNWGKTHQVSDSFHAVEGVRRAGIHPGPPATAYLGFRALWPLFGFGLHARDAEWKVFSGGVPLSASRTELEASRNEALVCRAARFAALQAGESLDLVLFVGLGLEAYGGIAGAEDLAQHGWDHLYRSTLSWLTERTVSCRGAAEGHARRLNLNALYNYFFSTGVTLDSERMVVTSSRSPRYDLTASYTDRDACLLSFPGLLMIDPAQARRVLEYSLGVQVRNVGSFRRYLDGIPLEPGLALDAVAAPLRALWMYVDLTGDHTILFDRHIQEGVNRVLDVLDQRQHHSAALYHTRKTPAGRIADPPYLTYSNALVWRALSDLADLYRRIRDLEREHETENWARDVRSAILEHCIMDGPFGPMFCFATDLEGRSEPGDEPEGSLLLLPYLELCRPDFGPYLNTVRWIREGRNAEKDGCCLLDLANEVLIGNRPALEELSRAQLDDGIACHRLDGSGKPQGGMAWAAGAGYLAYVLIRAFENDVDLPVFRAGPSRAHSRISRSAMRPGVGWV